MAEFILPTLDERGTSTDPFLLAQATTSGPKDHPWSKYLPFKTGDRVAVVVSVTLGFKLDFKGSGSIIELSDARLRAAVVVPFDVPLFGKGEVAFTIDITYIGDGPNNSGEFFLNGRSTKVEGVGIDSGATDRFITPRQAIEIGTGAPKPFPDKVKVTKLRVSRRQQNAELEASIEGFPAALVTISRTR